MIPKPLFDKVFKGDKEERKFLCQNDFELFISYYFDEYITYQFAPFHYDMFSDLHDLQGNFINELLWIVFREGAKTSIAKIFLTYLILYEKRYYINVDSFDKSNAESVLFDVVLSLQTNAKIVSDFGQLYNTRRTPEEVQRKKVSDFITSTGIRVEAHSTQESVRGRLFKNHRPDFFYIEDFETDKTAESEAYTHQILRHLNELKAGLSPNAWVLYSANYISDHGSVQNLLDRAKTDHKFRVRNVPLLIEGQPSWPAKYALTDKEALSENKVSIEEKRRKLGDNFNKEMMNDPSRSEDAFFDRNKVDADIKRVKDIQPTETKGCARYYARYNPSHRYALGGDISMGVKRDSCTAVLIDFTTIPKKVAVCADDNQTPPDQWAHELKRIGNEFGECTIAPECNHEAGGTCLTTLKGIYPIEKIYHRIPSNRSVERISNKLGWETNSSTKGEMFISFRSAYHDGMIEINDIKLLKEMRMYGQADLMNSDSSTTRHFDLLTAACIAWQMRNYAPFESSRGISSDYQQPEWESPSMGNIHDLQANPSPLRAL